VELTTVVEASWVRTTEGAADREEFFRTVPKRIPDLTSIVLVKYWFSTADQEPNLRFLMRIHDALKQWKLSPMDLESRRCWEHYTRAKEEMLQRTHIPEATGG
jgi:polyphosphate kinase 2 (PPK2 family)